jgi:hypothetical protein
MRIQKTPTKSNMILILVTKVNRSFITAPFLMLGCLEFMGLVLGVYGYPKEEGI